jgi:Arc/MetJ family transcription regulator
MRRLRYGAVSAADLGSANGGLLAMCKAILQDTHQGNAMRTNIEIDDRLMKRAMRACGAKTKRETVERSLALMVRMAQQEKLIRSARGKLHWEGDLAAMRRDRQPRE